MHFYSYSSSLWWRIDLSSGSEKSPLKRKSLDATTTTTSFTDHIASRRCNFQRPIPRMKVCNYDRLFIEVGKIESGCLQSWQLSDNQNEQQKKIVSQICPDFWLYSSFYSEKKVCDTFDRILITCELIYVLYSLLVFKVV